MHSSFINTPIAIATGVALTAVSLLSFAMAEEFDEKLSARESSQGAWYRLRDNHVNDQKSTENRVSSRRPQAAVRKELRPAPDNSPKSEAAQQADDLTIRMSGTPQADHAASIARWINVADTNTNRTLVNGNVNDNHGSLGRGAAVPPPAPREWAVPHVQPLALVPTSPSEVRDVWGPVVRTWGSQGARSEDGSAQVGRQVTELNERQGSVEERTSSGLRALEPLTIDRADSRTQLPPAMISPHPKLDRSPAEFELPNSVPQREIEMTQGGPSRPALKPSVCIQLEPATSRRLRLQAPIDRIEVEDAKVCEAIRQVERELHLFAKRNGETSVTIHYATDRTPDVYTVRVGSLIKPPGELDSELFLQALVTEMFPDSDVLLTPKEKQLVITGTVRSDAEAVRLLSFVRSLRLVPVVDQIKVRR